jgi:hypothetical protein
MFTLSRDLIAAALGELEQKEQDYYTLECPKCRRAIKVPRPDLERMQPGQ